MITKLLCWGGGLFGVVYMLMADPFPHDFQYSYDQNVLHDRLIRFSVINFSVFILLIPSLIKHGIHINRYGELKGFEKARTDLIQLSILLPGVTILLWLLGMFTRHYRVLAGVMIILLYRYLFSIYLVIKGKN